ncbi:hypothetical protein NMG60_11030430 [Bertholletia excelsa]
MDTYFVLLAIFVCLLLFGHGGVEGRLVLSKEEDLELDRQLKLLNKPAITTIQTDYGDMYDCVDFYKQPAFDHPALKNHSFHFQMEPTSLLSKRKGDIASSKVRRSAKIGLKGGGCPWGTVPIRRTTKEDLIRQMLISTDDNIAYAKVETKSEPNNNGFMGAGADVSLHNPQVTGQQYSAAVLKVAKGSDSIQAGWRAGQSHCFNTQCPGFVLVRSDIPLDYVFSNLSESPGSETQLNFMRDSANGNWWFFVGFHYNPIGFWPQRIFTALSDVADIVGWGGETFSPSGIGKPPMGTGIYPKVDTTKSAYFCRISVTLRDGSTVDAYKTQASRSSNLYNTKYFKNGGCVFRHLVFYGGPGGPV